MKFNIPTSVRIGALALALSVIAILATVRIRGGSGQNVERTDDLLLTGNRTSLMLCIQNAGPGEIDVDAARAALLAGVSALKGRANWASAGFDHGTPSVASGCNASPFILQPGVSVSGPKMNFSGEFPKVTSPSAYRLMVFVLPEAETERLFGKSQFRWFAQEMTCGGDTCAEVTTGLYVSEREIQNPAAIVAMLAPALGLEETKDDSSERGVPAPKE